MFKLDRGFFFYFGGVKNVNIRRLFLEYILVFLEKNGVIFCLVFSILGIKFSKKYFK